MNINILVAEKGGALGPIAGSATVNSYSFLKWRYISDLTHCVKIIGEEISKIDYLVSNNECVIWEQYNLARKVVSFPCSVSGDKYYTWKNCYNFVHFGKLPGITLEIYSHTSFSDISVTYRSI